jgi:hypothetical protein
MVVIDVDDAEAWHEHARKIAGSGDFPGVEVKPPEVADDTRSAALRHDRLQPPLRRLDARL